MTISVDSLKIAWGVRSTLGFGDDVVNLMGWTYTTDTLALNALTHVMVAIENRLAQALPGRAVSSLGSAACPVHPGVPVAAHRRVGVAEAALLFRLDQAGTATGSAWTGNHQELSLGALIGAAGLIKLFARSIDTFSHLIARARRAAHPVHPLIGHPL